MTRSRGPGDPPKTLRDREAPLEPTMPNAPAPRDPSPSSSPFSPLHMHPVPPSMSQLLLDADALPNEDGEGCEPLVFAELASDFARRPPTSWEAPGLRASLDRARAVSGLEDIARLLPAEERARLETQILEPAAELRRTLARALDEEEDPPRVRLPIAARKLTTDWLEQRSLDSNSGPTVSSSTPEELERSSPELAEVSGANNLSRAASRTSLDRFLDRVWEQRHELAREGPKAVYRKYREPVVDDVVDLEPRRFLETMSELAQERPAGLTQGLQPHSAACYFRRAGAPLDACRERVSLNPRAELAVDVITHVVKAIVDRPVEFPGVLLAKIAGAALLPQRSDKIVVFTTDAMASALVESAIAAFKKTLPEGSFHEEPPFMTDAASEGVGRGEEPEHADPLISFGALRTDAICRALHDTLSTGGSRIDFDTHVQRRLAAVGVDPERPHANLRDEDRGVP